LVNRFGPYDPLLDLPLDQFPVLDLLNHSDDQKYPVTEETLANGKEIIVDTLHRANLTVERTKATIGPASTLYEIVPAPGVRIAQVKRLESDIAMRIAVAGTRVMGRIPGQVCKALRFRFRWSNSEKILSSATANNG
jgi:S-DNA-T family DNA segregation ATPase FtsK/SpoIIIE